MYKKGRSHTQNQKSIFKLIFIILLLFRKKHRWPNSSGIKNGHKPSSSLRQDCLHFTLGKVWIHFFSYNRNDLLIEQTGLSCFEKKKLFKLEKKNICLHMRVMYQNHPWWIYTKLKMNFDKSEQLYHCIGQLQFLL